MSKLKLKDLDNEVNGDIPKKNKRKKRAKKSEVRFWEVCPFCQAPLPLDTNSKEYKYYVIKLKKPTSYWLLPRIQECQVCKSFQVEICPACKHPTWYSPKEHIYQHKWLGCGFKGRALSRRGLSSIKIMPRFMYGAPCK